VNRIPGGNYDPECASADAGPGGAVASLANQAVAAAAQGVQTFFVVFGPDTGLNAPDNDAATIVSQYQSVKSSAQMLATSKNLTGALADPVQVIDVTGSKNASVLNFAKVVEPLATCLYDLPATPPGMTPPDWTSASLTYPSNPLNPTVPAVTVPFVPSCSADAGAPSGWSIETVAATGTQRIRVCGQACTDLENLVAQAAEFSLIPLADAGASATPPSVSWIDVPLTLTPSCPADAGTPDGG
jgi:hypothetical protein